MTNLQLLKDQRAWALKWLNTPEEELPGALTHEKCYAVLEQATDELIDYLALSVDSNGNATMILVDQDA